MSTTMATMHRVVLFQRTLHGPEGGKVYSYATRSGPFKLTCNDGSLQIHPCEKTKARTALLPQVFKDACNRVLQFGRNFLSGSAFVCKNPQLLVFAFVQNFVGYLVLNLGLTGMENVLSKDGHKLLCWSLIKTLVYVRAVGFGVPLAILSAPLTGIAIAATRVFFTLPNRLQAMPNTAAVRLAEALSWWVHRNLILLPTRKIASFHIESIASCFTQSSINELSSEVPLSKGALEEIVEGSQLEAFQFMVRAGIVEEIFFRGNLLDWPLWAYRWIRIRQEKQRIGEDELFEVEATDTAEPPSKKSSPKSFPFHRHWVLLKSISFATMHIGNWLRPGLAHATTEDQIETFGLAAMQTASTFLLSSRVCSPMAETYGLAGAMGAHVTWNLFAFGYMATIGNWLESWDD